MQPHFDACFLRRVVDVHDGGLQQLVQRDALHVRQLFERIQARKGKQLFHQPGGAVNTLMQLHQRFTLAFWIVLRHLRHFGLHPQRR